MSAVEWLQVANLVSVLLLVGITGWYAWSSAGMLREMRDQARLVSKGAQIAAWAALVDAAAHPEGQNPFQKLRQLVSELERET